MGLDDQRAAVGMSVTLSSQLITAALAMLTIEGAFVAFALGNRSVSRGFGLIAGLAALSFIASIFLAGRGISQSRNTGFSGSWQLSIGKTYFNCQALFCLLGLCLFFVTFMLSGKSRESPLLQQIITLTHSLEEKVEQSIMKSVSNVEEVHKSLQEAVTRIEQLEQQLTSTNARITADRADLDRLIGSSKTGADSH